MIELEGGFYIDVKCKHEINTTRPGIKKEFIHNTFNVGETYQAYVWPKKNVIFVSSFDDLNIENERYVKFIMDYTIENPEEHLSLSPFELYFEDITSLIREKSINNILE